MTDSLPPSPAATLPVSQVPVDNPDDISPATHPDAYNWLPVPRDRRRGDGWTVGRQRDFIGAIADLGSVKDAAKSVGMSEKSAYLLRRAPGGEGFARAWDVAIDEARHRVLAHALDRVVNGDEVPVLDEHGQAIFIKRRYSDRLTMFLLRGYFPQRFGALNGTAAKASPPAPEIPVAQALDALLPPAPADVHLRMDPDLLDALAHGGDHSKTIPTDLSLP